MTQKTELENLEPSLLKSILPKTMVVIAVSATIIAGAGEVATHVKAERTEERKLESIGHFVPQSIFDLTRVSENAPLDLAVVIEAIKLKRDAMDRAVAQVSTIGRLLGWDDGPKARSEAYSAHMRTVQNKIDEITANGWQPTEYMKNRSFDQKELDDVFVKYAKNLYQDMIHVQPTKTFSR